MTNGVDFALVDGACCVVYLSKGIYNNTAGGAYPDITLNIDSTGAKPIKIDYVGMSSTSVWRRLIVPNRYYQVPYNALWFYTAGVYYLSTFYFYEDYSD